MVKPKRTKRFLIPPVVQPDAKTLQFSFKHLDTENAKFSVNECSADFLLALIKKIREYSQWPTDVFIDQNHEEHRHLIDFAGTSEPDGFAHLGTDQLAYVETWQFRVGKDRWRVMGFLLEDVFYIVWLDPNHRLYDGTG
jgi:hypothetical protein